jgi:hypothetical protein
MLKNYFLKVEGGGRFNRWACIKNENITKEIGIRFIIFKFTNRLNLIISEKEKIASSSHSSISAKM